jgi:Ca2+:H+ antiporter
MRLGRFFVEPLGLLLVFIPIGLLLELVHANPVLVFGASAGAILPLTGYMGKATEHLAERTGPGIGGLLNATFGNAAELIIALMALQKGLHGVVKASITGSIVGNILLVLGLSALCGGLRYERQTFNRTAAGVGSTLLALSAVGLLVPALFHQIVLQQQVTHERELSLDIAIVLFLTYLLSLVFSLRTHKHLYAADTAHQTKEAALDTAAWSVQRAVVVLRHRRCCGDE